MTAATLTDDEIARIKMELWDHLLSNGAEPYIGTHPVFNTIRDNILSSATAATSSSTAVTAAGQTTITLASATGIAVGYKVVIDCDDSREVCSVRSLAGSVMGVILRKTHAGTYPVEIESPLTIVRGLLFDLSKLDTSTIPDALEMGGIKRADEVEWFGPNEGGNHVSQLMASQKQLRMELARRIGLGTYAARNRGGGGYEQY